MANEVQFTVPDQVGNYYHEEDGGTESGNIYFRIGQYLGTEAKGFLRVPNVTISQGTSVNYAGLYIYIQEKGSSDNDWKFKVFGVDVDNQGFPGGNPLGEPHTSASTTVNTSVPGVGDYKEVNVTSIVNEIFARGGWSSGNGMGFIMENDGSSSDTWAKDSSGSGTNSFLIIRRNSEPDFFPNGVTETAPGFPVAKDYGIKIARPGFSVLTATEDELFYTSRKKQYKVIAEGQVTTVGGVNKLIPHGLGYIPLAVAFVQGDNGRFKLPRLYGGSLAPADDIQGTIAVNATNVIINTSVSKDVYYFIFIDELE